MKYRLTIEPLPTLDGGPDEAIRLRSLLKAMLRVYRLRCVRVEEVVGSDTECSRGDDVGPEGNNTGRAKMDCNSIAETGGVNLRRRRFSRDCVQTLPPLAGPSQGGTARGFPRSRVKSDIHLLSHARGCVASTKLRQAGEQWREIEHQSS
jgi:hypothetical protein